MKVTTVIKDDRYLDINEGGGAGIGIGEEDWGIYEGMGSS